MKLEESLIETITSVKEIRETLDALYEYALPDHYLAGGAITQCIWNKKLGLPLLDKVKDFDVVYYASESMETESLHETVINGMVSHNIPVDVKNQSNLHVWYGEKFGNNIKPLSETEDGIRMWLSAFAVGVRKTSRNYKVFSPYGLEDQANMIVRPNKLAMSSENYESMTDSFKQRWPEISVSKW